MRVDSAAVVFFTTSSPRARKVHSAQALVEFAFVVPVMLLLTLGMIDLGRAFVFGVAVQEGTRQAARLAASANYDSNVTQSAIVGRVIDSSNPAMAGCLKQTGTQSCNAASWTVTVSVVGASGSTYSNLDSARSANDLQCTGTCTDPAAVTITIAGSVALFPGVSTGNYGLVLPSIGVHGSSAMAIL